MRRAQIDPKVLSGIAVMVIATALGAFTMQRATQRTLVWQLDADLAAGTVLTAADVHVAELALNAGTDAYVLAGTSVVGRTLAHDVRGQELLPSGALLDAAQSADEVTIPVEAQHLPPDLRRGQRVDVWLTLTSSDGAASPAQRVLAHARVLDVTRSETSGAPAVVLAVEHVKVGSLVTAMRVGVLDLVGVTEARS